MADSIVNEWVNVVCRARLGSSTTLIALVIAKYANPDGTKVYPGLARLAVQCEISYSSSQRSLRKLRRVGLIELVRRGSRRRGQSDEYRLILGPNLLEHVKVPSPDEERADIRAVASKRNPRRVEPVDNSSARQGFYASPLTPEVSSKRHHDDVLSVTPDAPPSIGPLQERDPPSPVAEDASVVTAVTRELVDERRLDQKVGVPRPVSILDSMVERDVRTRQSRECANPECRAPLAANNADGYCSDCRKERS